MEYDIQQSVVSAAAFSITGRCKLCTEEQKGEQRKQHRQLERKFACSGNGIKHHPKENDQHQCRKSNPFFHVIKSVFDSVFNCSYKGGGMPPGSIFHPHAVAWCKKADEKSCQHHCKNGTYQKCFFVFFNAQIDQSDNQQQCSEQNCDVIAPADNSSQQYSWNAPEQSFSKRGTFD